MSWVAALLLAAPHGIEPPALPAGGGPEFPEDAPRVEVLLDAEGRIGLDRAGLGLFEAAVGERKVEWGSLGALRTGLYGARAAVNAKLRNEGASGMTPIGRDAEGSCIVVGLRVEGAAPWAHVVWVLDVLQNVSFYRIEFACTLPDGEPAAWRAFLLADPRPRLPGPRVEIAVTREGYSVGAEKAADATALTALMRRALPESDEPLRATAEIAAERDTPFRAVLSAAAAACAAGFERVELGRKTAADEDLLEAPVLPREDLERHGRPRRRPRNFALSPYPPDASGAVPLPPSADD